MAQSDDPELSIVPLESATALAARFYADPAVLEHEREQVFARSWQLAAHAGELAGAGDHVVCTVAGVPVLIVRGADGVLRAFHNVCRHRAGPLATASGRGATTLRCRYHGWTYSLDGPPPRRARDGRRPRLRPGDHRASRRARSASGRGSCSSPSR